MVTALNLIHPDVLYATIAWLDGVAAKATQYTGATYAAAATAGDWTVTFANGTTATVSSGVKAEYEKYVADATKYADWPTIKAEFIKVINEVVSQASASADAILLAAQTTQNALKVTDIGLRTTAQTAASSLLNGAPGVGQPVPPVWPDTVCVANKVEVCDGRAVSLSACNTAAPAPAAVPATVTPVAPIVGLYAQRDATLATLNAAKALET